MSDGWKKAFGIVVVSVVLSGASFLAEQDNQILMEGQRLERRENGAGDYKADLIVRVKDGEEMPYSLMVPERKLSREEETEFLEAACAEIEEEFPGENESTNCIRGAVCIRESYQEGRVTAEWNFDNYELVDYEGNVIATDISSQGELVRAKVELQCGDSVAIEEFYFRVFAAVMDEKEELLAQIQEELSQQEEQCGTDYIALPKQLGDYALDWQEKKSYTAVKILLFGLVLAAFIPALEKSHQRDLEKKRLCLMALEYPDIVSKMALLLGAGMTPLGAWKKISVSYEKKRQSKSVPKMPAYEEMLVTCHEIESGVGEQRAYEGFGNRCGTRSYRKFANILAQNLRKGNAGLIHMLETEAENSFEERKRAARRYGEEAGTKLLGPMMLMLGIVIVIIVVPAIITFQM